MKTRLCKSTSQDRGEGGCASAATIGRRHSTRSSSRSLFPLLLLVLCALFLCALPGPVHGSSVSLLASLSSSLELSASAPLTPSFSSNQSSYTQAVPFGATQVTFRAVAAQPANASLYATWNGQQEFAVQSGVTTATLQLGQSVQRPPAPAASLTVLSFLGRMRCSCTHLMSLLHVSLLCV